MIFKPLVLTMMQAYLDGRKTQTRRVVNPQPRFISGDRETPDQWSWAGPPDFCVTTDIFASQLLPFAPIQPGEFIWWQETWNLIDLAVGYAVEANFIPEEEEWPEFVVVYEADQSDFIDSLVHKWSRPELMPKRACRAVAEVLEVRAERIKEITNEAIIAEGFECSPPCTTQKWNELAFHFAGLWDSLHGHGAWNRNEWVWVYRFRPLKGDELKEVLEVLNDRS